MIRAVPNLLADRMEHARELLSACRLCPRNCYVNRLANKRGYCGADGELRLFREVIHNGEESELTPSHQLYFTGCNLRCEFCAVAEWNESPLAAPVADIDTLAAIVARGIRDGARNINLLGGEPSVNIYGILKFLQKLPSRPKIVWNTNMYFSETIIELLDGVADVYLGDFKCYDSECARVMLGAEDYPDVVKENLLRVREVTPLIVRHLLMPGHEKCCLHPILEWIRDEMPDVKVSLRGDYVPPPEAENAPLEMNPPGAIERARETAKEMGLNVIL